MTYGGPHWEITTQSKDDKTQNVMIVYSWDYYKLKEIADRYCKSHNHKLVSIKPWILKTDDDKS